MITIDTIKLFKKINISRNFFHNNSWNIKDIKHTNSNYAYFKAFKYFQGINFYYDKKFNFLSVTFSASKLLSNNNFTPLDTNKFLNLSSEVNAIVRCILKKTYHSDIRYWKVSRFDIASIYKCKDKNEKSLIITHIKNLNISRSNTLLYPTSIHSHNKSITYNFYDKTEEDNHCLDNIIKFELQFKNPLISKLKNKGVFESKCFIHVLTNIDLLYTLFIKRIKKLKFESKHILSKKDLSKVLSNLYTKNKVTKRMFKNLTNYFINGYSDLSQSTISKYNNILNTLKISPLPAKETLKPIKLIKSTIFAIQSNINYLTPIYIRIFILLLITTMTIITNHYVFIFTLPLIYFFAIPILDDS